MTLYLIPVFLSGNTQTVSPQAMEIAGRLTEFVVEDEKSARRFLKQINPQVKQDELRFYLLNEHTTEKEVSLLGDLLKGKRDIGLLSEAGCPGVADPGATLVRKAHQLNVRVIPLSGPSSILLALMASGLNGQSFAFHGYLPRNPMQRKQRLAQLEKEASSKNQSQVFIETPYRNNQLLEDILRTCRDETLLCVACDLTSEEEIVKTRSVKQWKEKPIDIHKRPAVFILGKNP